MLSPAACVICGDQITLRHKPSRPRRYCSDACYKQRSRPLVERFWEKVDRDGPIMRPELGRCWDWTGSVDSHGYGKLSRGVRGDGLVKATHVSWWLHVGAYPGVLDVCHRCDNPPCTRPDHLFLGTGTDNIRDAQRKGRLVGAGKGERHHRAVLTDDDVRSIRLRFAAGTPMREMAVEYRVSAVSIWSVIRRKTWKHIE
jgi:HNH endonuclease